MSHVRGSLWCAVAAIALSALGGCAAPPTQTADIRTNSDLTENDRRAKLRMELAVAYFGRGQLNTALDEVKQALAVRPDLSEGYNLRGLIYASMGQIPLAEESFARALQLNPQDADAMNNYGWFLCEQRRFDAAQAQFLKALAVPQYRDAARTMLAKGVCEARADRLEDAEHSLSKSYELNPANPTAAFSLAEVLLRRGELERALFYIRRVNAVPEATNAQSLWLAIRIEHKLGNRIGANGLGVQLRQRFPESPQALQFERGRLDD